MNCLKCGKLITDQNVQFIHNKIAGCNKCYFSIDCKDFLIRTSKGEINADLKNILRI